MSYFFNPHHALAFLARLIVPHGWPVTWWMSLFILFTVGSYQFAALSVDVWRRAKAPWAVVDVKIGTLVVTERRGGRHPVPRSVLVKPQEGKVYFDLIEPNDRVLEPVPSTDTPMKFGYYPIDCDVHASADVAREYRLVCRPFLVQTGSQVVLEPYRQHARMRRQLMGTFAFLVALVAVGLYPIIAKRRSWWWW